MRIGTAFSDWEGVLEMSILKAFGLLPILLASALFAQTPPRPHITGVSHIAIYAHDYEKSRAFYGQFLGFQEPYSLKNPD